MNKLTFWVMVAVAAILGIYVFKMVANAVPSQGLKDFAQTI